MEPSYTHFIFLALEDEFSNNNEIKNQINDIVMKSNEFDMITIITYSGILVTGLFLDEYGKSLLTDILNLNNHQNLSIERILERCLEFVKEDPICIGHPAHTHSLTLLASDSMKKYIENNCIYKEIIKTILQI